VALKSLEIGAMFPFLPEGREAVKHYDISLPDLVRGRSFERARKRGERRVLDALEGNEISDLSTGGRDEDLLEEILAYLYSRILVSAVNDRYLTRKFTVSEAKLFERRLKRLNATEEGREASADELSPGVRRILNHLQVEFDERDDGQISLHFSDYLKAASMIGDKHWHLVHQDVRGGRVILSREKAFRILEESYRYELNRELPQTLGEALYREVEADAVRLATTVREHREKYEGTGGVLDEKAFPPCIKQLMEMTGKSENVPHMGRFTMVAFLHTIGYDKEGLVSLFSRWPDFNIQKSMYQIQHIIGESSGTEYTPPMCATMKTYGICYNPDELCKTINHPLNYYRKMVKRREWDRTKREAEKPKAEAPKETGDA
jgi:DNA primase large subunit